MTEEEPLAYMGSSSGAKTMADGTLRIAIDIAPSDAIGAFAAFGIPGSPVALARIMNDVAVEHERPKNDSLEETNYGQEAKALYQSSFFRTPEVWEAIGTDKEYLEWVKHQASAKSGDFSEWHDHHGDKFCVAAHVRHIEHGSGTGIKPPYSAIPLTSPEHNLSHQKGDGAVGSREWWDKMRIKYVHAWCWETAKQQIQAENPGKEFTSFGLIPPLYVEGWATRRDILRHLPALYKGNINAESETSSEAR